MYKVDLHTHSFHSGDNDADPEEMIYKAIQVGLDGIAFTEHYYYEASGFVERLKTKYNNRLMLFRGVEFSALEGHCLVFGIDTDKVISKHCPITELINIVNERGGVVIPSHPYRGFNSVGDKLLELKKITAIEVYNGANMRLMNTKALDVAKSLNIPYTGGSDAHSAIDVGSCYTLFEKRLNNDNIVQLLNSGQYKGYDNRRFAFTQNQR